MKPPSSTKSLLMLFLSASTCATRVQACPLEGENHDFTTATISEDDQIAVPQNNEWFDYDHVDFTGATSVVLCAAHGANRAENSAIFQMRISSSTGTSIGLQTVNTSSWRTFQNYTLPVSGQSYCNIRILLVDNNDADGSGNVTITNIRLYESEEAPTTYAGAAAHFNWGTIPVNQRGPFDNPRGDRYNNSLNRALSGNLTVGEQEVLVPLLVEEVTPGQMRHRLSYTKAVDGLAYRLLWSAGLTSWFDTAGSVEQYDAGAGMHSLEYIPPAGTSKVFGWLEVAEPRGHVPPVRGLARNPDAIDFPNL